MLIGSEITYGDALSIIYEVHVKGNHADGDKVLLKKSCGKSPLCSGASQFAAGYAADWLSIDKRMSCTASDDALSILRAHYKMQINRDFTLIRDVGATTNEISERRR